MCGNVAGPATPAEIPVRKQASHWPTLAQSCVQGARHVRDGKPCQDAVCRAREGNAAVLAVADGHGTSARADVGAKLAVVVAVEQLLRFAKELDASHIVDLRTVHAYAQNHMRTQLVRQWVTRVRRDAGTEEADLQPYGSTLLFALATPSFVLVGQLGDGDILLVDADRRTTRPVAPDPANFGDETASLCQSEAWTSLRVHAMAPQPTEALLLLSTDGYSKSYATDADFERIGPDYLALFRDHGADGVERQLPEFLTAVSAGGSGDDIAFGAMYWGSGDTSNPVATNGSAASHDHPASPSQESGAEAGNGRKGEM
jgi:hypothetical protein